jgi:hypothetical protein
MIPTFQLSGDGIGNSSRDDCRNVARRGRHESRSDSSCAPYVVFGVEAPFAAVATGPPLSPGEARLVGARTLALSEGRLALVEWDPARPWREDSARLCALRDACMPAGDAAALEVAATDDRLEVRLGRAPRRSAWASAGIAAATAVLAGADWLIVGRRPWATNGGGLKLAAYRGQVATTRWGVQGSPGCRSVPTLAARRSGSRCSRRWRGR